MGALFEVSVSGDLRSLLRALGGHSLVIIIDVLVLTNVVRVVLIGRLILTVLIHLGGSQRLESNRSLNRLSYILIDNDSDSLSAISALRSELVALGLAQNGLTVFLGNQLGIQSVFLVRNQTLVGNLVDNLGTSNNLAQVALEVSISGNLRGLLVVAISRLAWLIRLARSRRLAIRRLIRLRGLGSFRGRGLYRLGLRRLAGLRRRRFLRLGRLLALRVARLLRLTGLTGLRGRRILRRRRRGLTLATITRLTRNLLGSSGGLRGSSLRRLLRLYSLILIVDVGVVGDVILLTSVGILAVLVHCGRGQVLKSNCLINSLGNTFINSDLDFLAALGSGRYESLLTVANYRVVAVLILHLGTQLSIQSVFLARDQVLVLDLIGDDSARLNLIALSLLSLGADGWLHFRGYGLSFILDVAVLGNLLLIRARSFLTVLIDLLGVQILECDGSLNDSLNIVLDLDVNYLLTSRLIRGEGSFVLADDLVLTLVIHCLVSQLCLQGVFLTRHQVGVLDGVLDSNASLYLSSVVKVSIGMNLRLPLSVDGLLLIVDIFVSSDRVLIS